MSRPVESDYTSHVAYTRALEEHCDKLDSELAMYKQTAESHVGEQALSTKAWAEYQNRMGIMRVFEGDPEDDPIR